MKIFYDFEFVERGPGIPIVPVSAGFVREDGKELYVINAECLSAVMRHRWLSVNVVPYLPIRMDSSIIFEWSMDHHEYVNVLNLDRLVEEVRQFITGTPYAELWAYYGAYDHVVLAQLFGDMSELPSGIPMFTHELQQLIEQHPEVKLPPDPSPTHHALADARWVKEAYERLDPASVMPEVPSSSTDERAWSDRTSSPYGYGLPGGVIEGPAL
jgi:3'-5' exoribonuclease-like protein